MKSYVNIILLLLVFAFQSCTQQNVVNGEPVLKDVYDVQISLMPAQYAPMADYLLVDSEEPTPTRYVVSVYIAGDYSKPIVTQTLSSNTFELSLPEGVYDFAFWADCGAYDVDDLKMVSRLANNDQSSICFSGRQLNFEVGETFPDLQVMLKRPVARLNLYAADDFVPAGSFTLSCSQIPVSYNVIEESYGTEGEGVYSFATDPNAQDALFALEYLFPPSSGKSHIVLSSGETVDLGEVPLKANHITNIWNIHYN